MTLVELLIALVITSLIVSTTLAMMFSTTRATTASHQTRRTSVRVASLQAKLLSVIHGASSFLGLSTDGLVLWGGDSNGDSSVNLDELVLIERDTGTNELKRYRIVWPTGWTQNQIDAANTSYPSSSNYLGLAQQAKTDPNFQSVIWMTGVTAFSVTLNNAIQQNATLVTIRLDMSTGDLTAKIVAAYSLREPQAPK